MVLVVVVVVVVGVLENGIDEALGSDKTPLEAAANWRGYING